MHNFKVQVQRLAAQLQRLFSDRIRADGNFYFYRHAPKLSDIELLAIASVAESISVNSENALFTQLNREIPGFLSGRISRARFNIRRRALQIQFEDVFSLFHASDPISEGYIVDSTPLVICKLARSRRSAICKDQPDVQPQYGYCHAKQERFFGFKLHLVTTQKSLPVAFSITQARVHDVKALVPMLSHHELLKM